MANLPINLDEILHVYATLKIKSSMISPTGLALLPSSSNNDSASVAKHLNLLNGIALLMVTEAQSDVAAVTMSSHAQGGVTKTVFHLMKSRDPNETEIAYYKDFINLLNADQTNSDELQEKIEELTTINCRAKILSRAIKLQKAVIDVRNEIPTWGFPPTSQNDVAEFTRQYPRSKNVSSAWPDLLDDFLVKGLHPENFTAGDIAFRLMLAHTFAFTENLLKTIRSPKLRRRLKKLAEYAQILLTITRRIKREKGKRIYGINVVSFGVF